MHLHRDESGLAGTILVIVIAWALAAVLMLTGTLIAARQIDDRVAFITGEVGEIKSDTRLVELTNDTVRSTDEILTSAEPLSGQLDQVNASANSIDGTVDDILATADSINGTVLDINGRVSELEPIVFQINDRASSIGASVDSINGSAGGILANVNSIRAGLNEGAAPKAVQIVDLVRGIKGDTGTIRQLVSSGEPGNLAIRGHANSIDCSPAVRPLSTHCQPGQPGGSAGGAAPLPGDVFGDLLGGGGNGGGLPLP